MPVQFVENQAGTLRCPFTMVYILKRHTESGHSRAQVFLVNQILAVGGTRGIDSSALLLDVSFVEIS